MSLPASELRAALQRPHLLVRERVLLAPLTHVRLGGPADFFVEALTAEGAAETVRICRELEVPLHVLGGGSNLLVADGGVRGVVLTLARLDGVVRDGTLVTAGAGTSLPSLLRGTRELGLAGLEVLTGIPAVVGGAVAMNAGTREGATFDVVHSLTVADAAGEIAVRTRDRLVPRYRDGGLGGALVLQATFALHEDDPKRIFARFEASLRRRNATQPVSERSVGCVFKNPPAGSAGQLMDAAGCKTMRRGAISVSQKHANYFVNEGGGTAADFLDLMTDVQRRVRSHSGVELEPEVKLWGG
jgi:UDP-N-acetylmuramate dehydrogenase